MILYEWCGKDGHDYRMAAGKHAIRPLAPGQLYELQIRDERTWWSMTDWNLMRAADPERKP